MSGWLVNMFDLGGISELFSISKCHSKRWKINKRHIVLHSFGHKLKTRRFGSIFFIVTPTYFCWKTQSYTFKFIYWKINNKTNFASISSKLQVCSTECSRNAITFIHNWGCSCNLRCIISRRRVQRQAPGWQKPRSLEYFREQTATAANTKSS